MSDLIMLVIVLAVVVVPNLALGGLGYSYGNKKAVSALGLMLRTILFCTLFGWTIVIDNRYAEASTSVLPSVLCAWNWNFGMPSKGMEFIPPAWLGILAQVVTYLWSVSAGIKGRPAKPKSALKSKLQKVE